MPYQWYLAFLFVWGNMPYEGFQKVEASARASGARDPGAVAAAVGRKKYGKKKFQKAAASGRSMKGTKPLKGR